VIALWACTDAVPEPPEDVAVYTQVIAELKAEPETAMSRCDGLSDAGTRGDCQLLVARRAVRGPSSVPTEWCDRVNEGLWRHECFFEAAETLRRRGRSEDAAAACLLSGDFVNDCAQHLWQTPVHRLFQGDATGFAALYPEALAIYERWVPALSEATDLDQRFWSRFWEQGFLSWGRDEAHCEGLPAEVLARCTQAVAVTRPPPIHPDGPAPVRPKR